MAAVRRHGGFSIEGLEDEDLGARCRAVGGKAGGLEKDGNLERGEDGVIEGGGTVRVARADGDVGEHVRLLVVAMRRQLPVPA